MLGGVVLSLSSACICMQWAAAGPILIAIERSLRPFSESKFHQPRGTSSAYVVKTLQAQHCVDRATAIWSIIRHGHWQQAGARHSIINNGREQS
ncbi:hypothetical protein P154DRAFT_524572 [Amniculicola lignicola CBS 123094]|uniref:Secreted protein n=1 Tax=Amniculicola lignicola CBS 123094 TaxID=1392246 RepID=A0A6A5WC25_9PLEO|nr:hypothetical protein P154DRAFT_524572 [Amniculicola lignicola CBS 123094]